MDRATDAATIEQEVPYVTFFDPDTYEPMRSLFEGCGAGKSRCVRFKKCYL